MPEVVTGLRQPTREAVEKSIASAMANEAPTAQARRTPISPEGTVYESLYSRYRIQITAPAVVKDPQTGRETRVPPVVAQFEEGVYVNKERDPKKRKEYDRYIQENPFYGLGRHFWLQSERVERDKAVSTAQAKQVLSSLPKAELERQVQELILSGALDIKLPPREESK